MSARLRVSRADTGGIPATGRAAQVLTQAPLLASPAFLDRPAIVGGREAWTWRQVHQAAFDLAERLRRASVVCNLCTSRASFVVTWLASLRSGVLMVLPPSGGHADLAGILKATKSPLIVTDSSQQMPWTWRSVAECLACPALTSSSSASPVDLEWQPDWDCTSVCLYTSGSTGSPEPQPKTLGQLVAGAQALGERLAIEVAGGLDTIERLVCSVPSQHMFGLEASVMLSLVHGIPVQEGRPLLPADVRSAFDGAQATAWVATPLHLRGLAQSREALPRCALILSSTMPLARPLAREVEELCDAPVLEIYGSTETGALAMRRTADEERWVPLSGVRFETTGGSIRAHGQHFCSPVSIPDAIHIDGSGCFELLGRASDMIKIGGRRASLAGLNVLLQELPGLDDGVFYVPSSAGTLQRLCVIYAGPDLTRAGVERWLRTRVDPAFMPRIFIHVDKLPRGDNGKLSRHALEALFRARQHRAHQPAPHSLGDEPVVIDENVALRTGARP